MNKSIRAILVVFISLLTTNKGIFAQISMPTQSINTQSSLVSPGEYTLASVSFKGVDYLDPDLLNAVTGLTIGQKIRMPHDEHIAKAIRNLWKQELFADIAIYVQKTVGSDIFLEIQVVERPRLGKFNFKGITKSEAKELGDKIGLVKSRVVTEAIKTEAVNKILRYYDDKGFANSTVTTKETKDTLGTNSVILTFNIDKGNKTKINYITFADNYEETDNKLKSKMKGTKEMARLSRVSVAQKNVYETHEDIKPKDYYWNNLQFLNPTKTLEALSPYVNLSFFSSSKFNAKKFEEDKDNIVRHYNTLGHRDAEVIRDTVYTNKAGHYNIDMQIYEGRKYYFGDITWRGNTKYSSDTLSKMLGIRKGDIYNQELLETRLGRIPSGEGSMDITTLYMDDGYLFFNVLPVETSIVGDTINFELRMTEGNIATIRNITIAGNDRTNENVIRREIRTLPGNKFSRSDIVRTNRELANLGFFNAEKIQITPRPNPSDGTVDIDYVLEEKSSDQLQLSMGFGGGQIKAYGNIGISFNNFSARKLFKFNEWKPLPMGDGQRLNLNYSANGLTYSSLNASFTEPWLGGKSPTALMLSVTRARYNQSDGTFNREYLNEHNIRITGLGVNFSKRVKWPDDNFVLSAGLNYNYYQLKNYSGFLTNFTNGNSNNLFAKIVLSRYTVDQPLYPRSGSNFMVSLQLTPPYSIINGEDYSLKTPSERYKFIEYHKYRFTGDWYQRVTGNLVLKVGAKLGFMGYYNKDIGYSPFERFQLGGDGLSGMQFFLVGRDIISQRGYEVYQNAGVIFNKYQLELRYPLSLAASATVYALAFAEAGNAWTSYKDYNPYRLNRSAGIGVRLFLPMFGLLGLDYGIGFDKYDAVNGVTNMKGLARFSFMLGQEPD